MRDDNISPTHMVNRTVLYDLAQQNHLCLHKTPLTAQRVLEQTRAHRGDLLCCSGTRWKEGNPVKKVRQPTLRLLLFQSGNIFFHLILQGAT